MIKSGVAENLMQVIRTNHCHIDKIYVGKNLKKRYKLSL